MQFKMLKDRSRANYLFCVWLYNCDLQAKAENKRETMTKEYFWCKILLSYEKLGSNKLDKKMP